MGRDDVIAAVATPPGRGAVGIVRLSGPNLARLFPALVGRTIPPRAAVYTAFLDGTGDAIDSGIALFFPAPKSYTGEDVMELQGHGGEAVTHAVLARCIELGARLAEPGEFTLRAYLNGKIDLAQAEAVADLVDAQTDAAARAAMRSLRGAFSSAVRTLQDSLLSIRIELEGELDFPEEPVGEVDRQALLTRLEEVTRTVRALMHSAARGERLRAGARVVILGRPNVGKSSLLNYLAADAVAIVTELPGTTRDVISVDINIKGITVRLLDTAGVRDDADTIEKIGIERAREEARSADVVLLVEDAAHSSVLMKYDLPEGVPFLKVYNKVDLVGVPANQQLVADVIYISAKTGFGMERLQQAILEKIQAEGGSENDIIARRRHLEALREALEHMTRASEGNISSEVIAEELRLASQSLGRILGQMTPDDLLGHIFSTFCIGK